MAHDIYVNYDNYFTHVEYKKKKEKRKRKKNEAYKKEIINEYKKKKRVKV
jgi:hypothetical protein